MSTDIATGTPPGLTTLLDGEEYLRIEHFDRMAPFLMTLPSDTDLWMFVSSFGGLTAGRVSPEGSLFPYVTADLLHDAHGATGPITVMRVHRGSGAAVLWQPFDKPGESPPDVERNLYKNITGNRLVFEEIHHGLGLVFRYRWAACGAFGHVRTATLIEQRGEPVVLELLDGLRNLLPAGVGLALMQQASVLADAYKRNECDAQSGIGIFSLTSRITDRAEPGESLRAHVAAVAGLPGAAITLSHDAVKAFRRGETVPLEHLVTGRRGHYFALVTLALQPHMERRWHLVADALRTQEQVAALRERWLLPEGPGRAIDDALDASRERLRALVASADGMQSTAARATVVHHFANVLFNVMRGGVFVHDHEVPIGDFGDFIATRDRRVAERHASWLETLRVPLSVTGLRAAAATTGDPDLERLAHEYLPIHFGRRHGDPSRPWNQFRLHADAPDGAPVLGFEGNWRDIFQNWEALALGFPDFLPNLIAVFVNASTVDGFNPYRLTREGVEWEMDDPGHPWSNFGYWGDHQIVYLTRLLEAMRNTLPGTLEATLAKRIFCYADVPYRIVPFARMLRNPRATMAIDRARAARVEERVRQLGTDGRRVTDAHGRVFHVTLIEKLLVPVLAKLSNFVPGAGIWMNTQRPEWNDANNALVGNGVSVVTLFHLRRHLECLRELLVAVRETNVSLSTEVARWLADVVEAFRRAEARDPRARMALLCAVGEAFSRYRERAYADGLGPPMTVALAEVLELIDAALPHLRDGLDGARRDDGLYHSYHLLELDLEKRTLHVRALDLMLEGQVAALGSGHVEPAEAVSLLDALFASSLYRSDQKSFLLYPERELPGFLERNIIPAARARTVGLIDRLLQANDGAIVVRDVTGAVRFHPDFRHAGDLTQALDGLATRPAWRDLVARDRAAVLEIYEEVFRHRAFTGRSGAMYGYEGIGSVYWHMVAKLLLAVQETHARALREGAPEPVIEALTGHYHRLRRGFGFMRSAESYGAFPTDPYSHTPAHAGAQQPGMSGQVKEEILTRFGELGARVANGQLTFRPRLLSRLEFLSAPGWLEHPLAGGIERMAVPSGGLGFTYAGTPVLYRLTHGASWLRVVGRDGNVRRQDGDTLDGDSTRALLSRQGSILRVEVGISEAALAVPFEEDGTA